MSQLLAIVPPTALTTYGELHLVPALIADAGDAAGWRYVEFFTANIRNPNTRRAYARACSRFFAWCDGRGLALATIRPHDGWWACVMEASFRPVIEALRPESAR
jgi:hypothetical protein